jgi:hypothetical protein
MRPALGWILKIYAQKYLGRIDYGYGSCAYESATIGTMAKRRFL